MSAHTSSQKKSAYLGWLFISIFFCYQYILRVTPGIITNELRTAFNMTAEEFAHLGAIYLYAYAALQIPLGFIVDRVGVKKVVLVSIFSCALGTLMMGTTESVSVALLSRLLIGAGSGCAFMSAVKWVADYFPEGNRGFLMGATLVFGVVGALSAGTILVTLVETMTWRPAILLTGWMGLGLFVITAFAMKPSAPTLREPLEFAKIKSNLWEVLSNKNVLIYAALATGLYTPLSVLADLWGVSFLSQKFDLPRAEAASTVMYLYIGLAVGCFTLPTISEKLKVFVSTIRLSTAVIFGLFCWIVFGNITSIPLIKVLFLILGFFAGAEMICFTGAVLHSIPGHTGLTVGIVNMLNMATGAVLEQMIGKALDFQWNGAVNEIGLRVYTTEQYVNAMSILSGIVLICVMISFVLREKKTT